MIDSSSAPGSAWVTELRCIVGMPALRARSSASERELFEITTRISASSEPSRQASMIA